MEPKVVHAEENKRYEIFLGEDRVGLMDYSLAPGEIHLVHTEVDPAHQGKNLAAILLRESLADIRTKGTQKTRVEATDRFRRQDQKDRTDIARDAQRQHRDQVRT